MMTDMQLTERERTSQLLSAPEVETPALPLREVPDWDEQLGRATEACRLIDQHLDYEARGRLLTQLRDFRPQHLCPEQRVQMVSDLYGAAAR